MKKPDLKKVILVSKFYFEDNLTQDEISKIVNISIPQVSRLINYAKENGYVQTFVNDPFSKAENLSKDICKKYNLKSAKIVDVKVEDYRIIKIDVAKAAAEFLVNIMQMNDSVALAFSEITSKIPRFLPTIHYENLTFLQLCGAMSEHVKGYLYDTVRESSLKTDATYYYFPAPAVVENIEVRDSLHRSPNIKYILELLEETNIALFSANLVHEKSMLAQCEYFSSQEIQTIKSKGAVAEVYGHFIDDEGKVVDENYEDRVIGHSLDLLKSKDYSVCISSDKDIARSIHATLVGGYSNVLITDSITAKDLLEI